MIIRKYMIPVYGRLVMAGLYTLDPAETTKNQVPDIYVERVAEWIANYVGE